jgi:YggT family protein
MGIVSSVLLSLCDVYTMVLFVYVMMSWIPNMSGVVADVYTVLGRLSDPYLDLFRRFIPPIGNIDISPIFAMLVLQFVVRLIAGLL